MKSNDKITKSTKKMPVLFTGHGSPMNAIGNNKARLVWKNIGETLPKVIIAISAHWVTRGLFVRNAADNPQINDMYGFPKELYQVHYEPAGSPEFAQKTLQLLEAPGSRNSRPSRTFLSEDVFFSVTTVTLMENSATFSRTLCSIC